MRATRQAKTISFKTTISGVRVLGVIENKRPKTTTITAAEVESTISGWVSAATLDATNHMPIRQRGEDVKAITVTIWVHSKAPTKARKPARKHT